ncbi:HNH endonuclease signature motif containing protein [Antribacter gilvus]|uniref:HNH endonuclease signature motif containing protein n=1 Tax=Antribacter gilvus TaxID=2304675 RepID=UPI000F7A4708|nr:HNH endonuclease signature motif containing protein [Antribacter gilvus]
MPDGARSGPGAPGTPLDGLDGLDGLDALDGLGGGPGLAAALAALCGADTGGTDAGGADGGDSALGRLDDVVLLDAAAGWSRLIGWATTRQAAVAGELGRRRGWSVPRAQAAVELGARLGVPTYKADKVMARGAGLARHPAVGVALVAGVVDVVKVDLLLTAGSTMTVEQRVEAIAEVLPQAGERSRSWVRDQMRAHARRHLTPTEVVRAERDRRAVYLDPVEGGTTAWLTARLPATDAVAVWEVLDTAGRAIKRAGRKDRTLDHARADALVAILTGHLVVPTTPTCAPTAPAPAVPTVPEPTVPEPTAPATPEPAAPKTAAPEPAAPEPTAPAVPGFAPGVPRTTLPAPGTSSPGPASPGASDSGDLGSGNLVAGGCVCGGCLCDATKVTVLPVRASVHVTVAASTLLGQDDEPGFLAGFGPLDAETTARLAQDGTWQRLVTDPLTGILTDYSTHAYVPGPVLRAAVTERDRTCQFPQCDRPGTTADLDHIDTFDHTLDPATHPPGTPGQTRAGNLQVLCRRHHNVKTHHGWSATRDQGSGLTVWTAPTGHTYTHPAPQTATTTATTLTRRAAPSLRAHDNARLNGPTTNISTGATAAPPPDSGGPPF